MNYTMNAVYLISLMPKILLSPMRFGTKRVGNELKELFQH